MRRRRNQRACVYIDIYTSMCVYLLFCTLAFPSVPTHVLPLKHTVGNKGFPFLSVADIVDCLSAECLLWFDALLIKLNLIRALMSWSKTQLWFGLCTAPQYTTNNTSPTVTAHVFFSSFWYKFILDSWFFFLLDFFWQSQSDLPAPTLLLTLCIAIYEYRQTRSISLGLIFIITVKSHFRFMLLVME